MILLYCNFIKVIKKLLSRPIRNMINTIKKKFALGINRNIHGQKNLTLNYNPAHILTQLINVDEDYAQNTTLARAYIKQCRVDYLAKNIEIPSATQLMDSELLVTWLLEKINTTMFAYNTSDITVDTQRFILTQYAPRGLLSGCIIQNFANASNCHEPIPALIHAIHSWQVGDGLFELNHSNLYKQLLESVDLNLPKISSKKFSSNTIFLTSAWNLPLYQLSLSLFPESNQLEILGALLFDIALLFPGLQPYIGTEIINSKYYIMRQHTRREQMINKAKTAIRLALTPTMINNSNDETLHNCALRIIEGFMLCLQMYNTWLQEIIGYLAEKDQHPYTAMVNLIRRKAKFAVGYHQRLKLAGHIFDDLISTDAEKFVQELSRSPWISPGNPDNSLLLTKLINFGGPMFRVFTEHELQVIRTWIRALPNKYLADNKLCQQKAT